MALTSSVHFSSASDQWATPRDLLAVWSDEFGPFELDPCADADNAACARYFSEADNGLAQAWEADCVWMNPPYGRAIGQWIAKAWQEVRERRSGRVVCLLPARTDTKWWQDIVQPHAALIRFLRGRVRFGTAPAGAPFPSALVVFDLTARPSLTRRSPRV